MRIRGRRAVRLAAGARDLARAVATARRVYGAPPLRTARRARRLRVAGGFTHEEALRAGLLDPALPAERAARQVSKDRVTRLSEVLNPPELTALTEEKAIFYRVAAATGLPTPRLHGVVGRAGAWSAAGPVLPLGPAGTAVLLATVPAAEFVVKPSAGYHGLGVRVLVRDGDALIDLDGSRTTPAALAQDLHADPRWDLFVVQERLRNHPGLDAVCRTDTLQTLRVTTYVADDGRVQVVHAGLRLALGGGGVVDNFRGGSTGNALAEVDVRTGEIGTPLGPGQHGLGLVPAAGGAAPVHGVRLPEWPAVLDLVRRAARELMPRRNIGWDVAITTRGPLIIEANRSYDPWPSPAFGDVIRAVERAHARGAAVTGVTVA